ncbi:S-adenosyl-L-methionine-dependent methyltransferase [Aspergillus heteromorphus CBS 117.55]|uniref:S-adenosyl-L-methionine-dependent methyltransferase n=1 Tax=Aspergillus heteromorphus CBS 117.55 TaxID=1448321 RepID=A0A317VAT2_9EURO|nr:S-adenosyl-L-methionine-dependent methyltransferase [Aspergillus heteromorphus CBS 117.55]PWY70177.1 S-adenosyl-L-methionine-dependent methyltransferase [Aspergillus heteromorphus CBS 117.55]
MIAVLENGRRYCNGTYFMPNDGPEQTRLNVIHQIYLILLDGRLTAAPVALDTPRMRILDVGTGPGDWAIEMGTAYPDAAITASEIGVFEHGLGHVGLPNVYFQLDDARDEWAYTDGPFDLIHLRGLAGAFPDWPFVCWQAFRHLAPGGYVGNADTDFSADAVTSISANSYLRLFSALRSATDSTGYPWDMSHLGSTVLSAEGFVDVDVYEYTFPLGLGPDTPRERTLGKKALVALLEGLEAFSIRPLTATYG